MGLGNVIGLDGTVGGYKDSPPAGFTVSGSTVVVLSCYVVVMESESVGRREPSFCDDGYVDVLVSKEFLYF